MKSPLIPQRILTNSSYDQLVKMLRCLDDCIQVIVACEVNGTCPSKISIQDHLLFELRFTEVNFFDSETLSDLINNFTFTIKGQNLINQCKQQAKTIYTLLQN